MVMLFQTTKQPHHKLPESRYISPSKVERAALYRKFADKLIVNPELTRFLVSFQANKSAPFYRWLKYKEAFSSDFVKYVLDQFHPDSRNTPQVLDPFAGAGTTLTTSSKAGWKATGIELLPVGIAAIRARLSADKVSIKSFKYHLDRLENYPFDFSTSNDYCFPHLRITEKAFSKKTEKAISSYMTFVKEIKNADTRYLFWLACLSILEDVSFTRKDGQYLRWDTRSGRSLKSNFNKGNIPGFRTAITSKLHTMREDLKSRNGDTFSKNVKVVEKSCLLELAKLPSDSFDLVITSPPYCNRYDYTRTYALELAFMNHTEQDVRNLRQTLLSATVENRTKRKQLAREYYTIDRMDRYKAATRAFTNQQALHEVLDLLYDAREQGKLNNNNIPNLVENYFFEMNIVIHELSSLLAPGGRIIMVNDNVQYHGEEVPVDFILSDFAESAGLQVDYIWVLPHGKGNSSQQMGAHGRNEIRKCVYVWSKPTNKRLPKK